MSRMMEAAVIMIGVVACSPSRPASGLRRPRRRRPAALSITGQALVIARDWTFLFGPGFMASSTPSFSARLLYRSRLVPRVIPAIGLIGAPILLAANLLTFFGHNTQTGGWTMLATAPIFVWELSVGLYMTFKGFKQS